jgi:endonuclease III
MTLKTEIVALAVRVLAEKNIIRKPDTFTELLSTVLSGQTFDQRIANDVVASADKAVAAVKRAKIERELKKPVIHVSADRL